MRPWSPLQLTRQRLHRHKRALLLRRVQRDSVRVEHVYGWSKNGFDAAWGAGGCEFGVEGFEFGEVGGEGSGVGGEVFGGTELGGVDEDGDDEGGAGEGGEAEEGDVACV